MEEKNQKEGKASWGIHINHKRGASYPEYPEWVKAGNQMAWTNFGVIIWDEPTPKVECLFPQQALDVLDDLRESTTWENEPFCLSWDSYMLPFSEEKRKEWRATHNRRNQTIENESALNCLILSPEQTRELFSFLEKHEVKSVYWAMRMQRRPGRYSGSCTRRS
jgi:hypothetical protein